MNTTSSNLLDPPLDYSTGNSYNIIVTHTTVDDEESAFHSDQPRLITRGMMRERAVQLAVIHGRLPHEASKADWETAKLEVIHLPRACPLARCG